jgi:hypothetical protein
LFRGELFSNAYSSVKLFDTANWATYCSCDGKYLNYTFRRKVNKVILNLHDGDSFKLFGYTGAGLCESESETEGPVSYTLPSPSSPHCGEERESPNWKELISKKNNCSDVIFLDQTYKCYRLILNFV